MARKPNYRFERHERERVQAEKRAARDALKEQRKVEEADPMSGAAEELPAEAAASAPGADAPADYVRADHVPADHVPADHAPANHVPADARAPLEAQKGAVNAAMKPIETMTPEEIATLHQNAQRLASTGNAKQRAAAHEMLPRLEAALQRIGDAKRQAAAARLAGAAKRAKKE